MALLPSDLLRTGWLVSIGTVSLTMLKEAGVLQWSWRWVLSPLWLGGGLWMLESALAPLFPAPWQVLGAFLRGILVAAALPTVRIIDVVDWPWWLVLSPLWLALAIKLLFFIAIVVGPRIIGRSAVGYVLDKSAVPLVTMGGAAFATLVLAVLKVGGAVSWPWWVILVPLGANVLVLAGWAVLSLATGFFLSRLLK